MHAIVVNESDMNTSSVHLQDVRGVQTQWIYVTLHHLSLT